MSDYLWDKTGEPEAEVERLEKLLGTLAHRPRALELPAAARVEHTPRTGPTRPLMAAAAALALLLLAGAWLFASRRTAGEKPTAALQGNMHILKDMLHKPLNMEQSPDNKLTPLEQPSRQQSARTSQAARRPRRETLRASAGSVKKNGGGAGAPERDVLAIVMERQQSAKAQLVYALRLTGAKLSEVQTKVRGASEGRPAPEERNKIR